MTQQETLDYNKMCAEFLGWEEEQEGSWYKNTDTSRIVIYSEHNNYPFRGLPFARDWNWIMEVVEAIEKKAWVNIKGCAVDISTIVNLNAPTKKEAVVQAINQFLTWYNEQNN